MRPVTGVRRSVLAVAGSLLILSGLMPVAAAPVVLAAGTVSLTTTGSAYAESFDTLASTATSSTVPNGWDFVESGTNANTTYTAGTGSSNTGDTYSFGASGSSERAFGGLLSGSLAPTIGASLTNNTGSTIASLDVAYTGEQWRLGAVDRQDRLDFQYSVDATSLTTGTWINVDALDFVAPTTTGALGALDGNAAQNRTSVSGSVTGLEIAHGASFWVRWSDFNAGGADDGLGIDGFSLTPIGDALTINELVANHVGTDTNEYVEVRGQPGRSYAGYSLLQVEGDSPGSGIVDSVHAVGTTSATGHWVTGFLSNVLENATMTLLLVEGFTGAVGNDLDTNDDGVFDTTPWTRVVDDVAVGDGGTSDRTYSSTVLAPGFGGSAFTPGGASRIPDGADTDTTADWAPNDFDLAGIPGFTGTPVVGEALNTPGASNKTVAEMMAEPAVTSTTPADGASNVATNTPLSVTFSEEVTLDADAIAFECDPQGPAVLVDSGPAATFSLISVGPLPEAAECSITVDGSKVHDADDNAMAGTFSATFTTQGFVTVTKIHAIQGTGGTAATGTFTVEAIVVGDYQAQGPGQLRGFFLQEQDADADADPATSEGIFVFCSSCPVAVTVGDHVRVTGASSESFGMSQLSATTASSTTVMTTGNPLPTPATIELPVPGVPSGNLAAATAAINAYFEAFEGMLVSFPDTLSVSEYFELARYGQVILREGGRPHTFTAVNEPSAGGLVDHTIDLARRTVILDDTDNRQNRPVDVPNTPYYHPVPGLSTTNFIRGGDTITNLTGVLHWSFAGQTGTDAWRIRPVTEAFGYAFTPVNLRPSEVPDVGGALKVASFNVLNYFLTIDTTASNDVGTCGPSGTMDCRGADSATELERQRTKLLAALSAMDADILGLMEMENTPGVEPLADIVAGLPGYAYIDTGVIGTDAIRVGIVYKTSTVTPVGDFAILDSTVDPRFVDTRNRPALAQTFMEHASGGLLTVAVNHLKSKGSGCGPGDDDATTGQGNCNGTRTLAAEALADWLAGDPTASGDADVLIIGDLNSYAKEDPIVALQDAGYTDLVASFGGPGAYGFVFDGQLGYLDHALANSALAPQVTGVAEWHVNADEIPLLDYNDEVRDAGEAAFEEESDVLPLNEPNEFRTSDHDPIIVGLDLKPGPLYLHNSPTPPTGNTRMQHPLPMDFTSPTATTLFNYDTNRDPFPGRLIQKGGSATTTDRTKYQNWRSGTFAESLELDGDVQLVFWSAMKDFKTDKRGHVVAYLMDGSTVLSTASVNPTTRWQSGSTSWVEKTLTFSGVDHTIAGGGFLELRLVVHSSSDDDMWFAYDTVPFPSRLILP